MKRKLITIGALLTTLPLSLIAISCNDNTTKKNDTTTNKESETTKPEGTTTATTPSNPVKPATPEQPNTPAEPTKPVAPEQPATPTEPNTAAGNEELKEGMTLSNELITKYSDTKKRMSLPINEINAGILSGIKQNIVFKLTYQTETTKYKFLYKDKILSENPQNHGTYPTEIFGLDGTKNEAFAFVTNDKGINKLVIIFKKTATDESFTTTYANVFDLDFN
ncbi:hypothetical protein [Mycoplasma crocodyli]|uniref:Putative lipoprotein n=1 Tax=Mycoplasma crocodyli (strain ATCC 51981 / MP145) TaxID=512564 RepID=D5E639_MYCCM|nr:hypothetical protein [Mycoplasma crocodyli]ADE19682.1 putative lipoprotein [Mycoplasma crocodyli MP145]